MYLTAVLDKRAGGVRTEHLACRATAAAFCAIQACAGLRAKSASPAAASGGQDQREGRSVASSRHRVGYGDAAIAGAAGPVRAAGRHETQPVAGRQRVRPDPARVRVWLVAAVPLALKVPVA